jgi:MFS family permease
MGKLSPQAKALLYGGNMWYFGEGMFGPLFAIFANRIGGDILDITWAWAIYLIISGVLIVVFGELADTYSKEKLMIGGYALNAILTFAYLLVSTPAQLFLIQAGLAVASAMATPTWDALYDKYSGNGKNDGTVWGVADGTPNIITGLAIIAGGLILTHYSFTVLFVTMGIIQVIATLVQLSIFTAKKKRTRRKKI